MFDIEDRRQEKNRWCLFPAHSRFSSPATKIVVLSEKILLYVLGFICYVILCVLSTSKTIMHYNVSCAICSIGSLYKFHRYI